MSFLSSLLNIFSSFTLTITDGFLTLPATKLRTGSAFSNMSIPVNYVNNIGQYFLGKSYGSNSVLASPNFTLAPNYTPGNTIPPRAFPTYQTTGYVVPLGVNPANMYSFSDEGRRHMRAFEGLHQRAYIINGQKLIGYGHRLNSNDNTTYISRDQAEMFLQSDISAMENQVKGIISSMITQGQFDALVDFAYTVDSGKFNSSKVVSAINGGDIPGACTALAQYCYGNLNGIISKFPHLISRRTANIHWMTGPILPQPVN